MNKKLLIIGYIYPEPTTNAAGIRMMQLIDFFNNQGFEITFGCAAEKTPYSANLSALEIQEVKLLLNDSSFDAFIKKLNPAIVVFDRFFTEEQFSWRVAENCPHALRILDTEDLHFLRKAREISLLKQEKLNLINEVSLREMAAILRSDSTLIISKTEIQVLQELGIPEYLLWYFPLFFSPLPTLNSWENRNSQIVFVGNYNHAPNADAVEYLHRLWKNIAPHLPEAQLHIYGTYIPQKIQELHQPKHRFYISGRVEHIQEVYQNARLMLAPLRFGAGLKGKLLEAAQYGLPSVTTTIGSEGIVTEPEHWPGAIANDPEEIIHQTVQLYRHKNRWTEAQQKGNQVLHSAFDKENFAATNQEKLKSLLKNLPLHRHKNWLGKLLYLQQYQASKYMSKWIEEKNKN